MTNEYLRDWNDPSIAARAARALHEQMMRDSASPDAGVKMCHAQGKTAVYVCDDGIHMVWHAPDGTIHRKRRDSAP